MRSTSRTARPSALPRAARIGLVAWVASGSIAVAATARAETGTQTMPTSVEAWYTLAGTTDPVPDLCAIVGQCPPGLATPPPNPYPADTLHVDLDAGHERARTYLAFDLGVLPLDAVVSGGTVRLPIAEAAAGTVGAEEAKLQLCIVRSTFKDTEASIEEPPAPDCNTPVPITIEDKEGKLTGVADLALLAPDWEAETTAGVAVMPTAAAVEADETWHVAFSGRDREADGAMPITASFDYSVTEIEDDDGGGSDFFEDGGAVDFGVPSQFPDLGVAVDAAPPAPVADLAAPGVAQEAVAEGEVVVRRFAYPLVFLLPILLLGVIWYFGDAFTARPLPVARRSVGTERG